MRAPVNIYASYSAPLKVVLAALVPGCLMAFGACAGRPALDQAWFEPNSAALNSGVGHAGAMPPVEDARRRAHVARLDREWAAEEVKVLERKLQQQRSVAGLRSEIRSDQEPDGAGNKTPSLKVSDATARAKSKRSRAAKTVQKPASSVAATKSDGVRGPSVGKRAQGVQGIGAKATKPQVKTSRKATAPSDPRPKNVRRRTRPKLSIGAPSKTSTSTSTSTTASMPMPSPAGLKPRKGDRSAMGDGSVPSEMVAAARRLVGLSFDNPKNTFLRHLMVSAAVDLSLKAAVTEFDGLAVVAMIQKGWRLGPKKVVRELRAGDLVAFDHTRDVDGDGRLDRLSMIAVVESFDRANSVATCIGVVSGKVMRFALSVKYPRARRNEATATVLNDRLVGPRPGAVLAGELFHLAIRPTFR